WPAFAAMLETVRETGIAHDRDEHTPGISAIGFAFRDRGGEIHAISVPVPSQRLADREATITPVVRAARNSILQDFRL
ncbi:MAG: IclR family transcriptional regulator C-terminal domain-containing protein, partial [Pararhodobacter sp.]